MDGKTCSFSEDERLTLKRAYDDGLNSTKKENLPRILEVAKQLKRSEEEIKNWIGNERRRLKGKSRQASVKKPPQKLRAPNSYNLFVKDFFKSPEGQRIKDLGERNRVAAQKWHDSDKKGQYQQLAAQIPSVSSADGGDKWHETRRVLKNMQENCEWAQKLGIHMCYVLCDQSNHYAGGTDMGRQFLESNPQLPISFMVSTKPGIVPEPPEPKTLKELRNGIQSRLNTKYSLAVGNPNYKVPYRSLTRDNVVGWPSSVKLSHPSLLTNEEAKLVYESIEGVKFVGVPPDLATTVKDHDYCKSSKRVETPKHTKSGHCTLSISSNNNVCLLEATTENVVECGGTVNLLSSQYEQIGTAITISGNILHGIEIPQDYMKVAIQSIQENIRSWPGLKGDGHMLTQGSISAWPIRYMRNIKL